LLIVEPSAGGVAVPCTVTGKVALVVKNVALLLGATRETDGTPGTSDSFMPQSGDDELRLVKPFAVVPEKLETVPSG
jgi:hypothetical protein